MIPAGFARVLVVLCVVGAAVILWCTRAAPGSFTTMAGAPIGLGADAVSAGMEGADLEITGETPTLRLWDTGRHKITVALKGGRSAAYEVSVVDRGWLFGAIGVLVLAMIAAPYAFFSPRGAGRGPWAYLLTEPGGGLSLGRVQLLVWVLPATVLYGALSMIGHALAPIDSQLAILLGLSGATTTLGAASNPPAANCGPETPPRLADLVQDWDGRPDLSRYQYLFLSTIASVVIIAACIQNLQFPDIPTPILYLVAASQGTYLATKAVKTSRDDARGDDGAPQGLTAAIGAAPSVLRLGAGRLILVDAPEGDATEDGSMVVGDAKGQRRPNA